jgi:hypothetical protein
VDEPEAAACACEVSVDGGVGDVSEAGDLVVRVAGREERQVVALSGWEIGQGVQGLVCVDLSGEVRALGFTGGVGPR